MRRDPPWSTALACATTLDETSRSVRAGLSLSSALLGLSTPTPVLAAALDAHRFGRPLATALAGAVSGAGRDERLVLAVLTAAARHGGPVAEALDRTAATLRGRAAVAQEAHAQAAAGRLSATVLTAVPVGFAALSVVTDPQVRSVLLTTSVGWACLAIGGVLNLAGRRWMASIVDGTMRR